MSLTEEVLTVLIGQISKFANTHEWGLPEKFKTPALVWRVDAKKTPLKWQRWRTLSDRTRWAVAKVELDLHLFWVDKFATYLELDSYLRNLRSFELDGELIKVSYQPFTPYREEEFLKKGLKVWHAVLTAKFVEFVDTPVLEISVEAKEDG